MFIPFGFGGVGFGVDSDSISPEVGVGIGGIFLPNQPFVTGRITQRPNRHQRQGKSRKGRSLYGAAEPKRSSNDINISGLFS